MSNKKCKKMQKTKKLKNEKTKKSTKRKKTKKTAKTKYLRYFFFFFLYKAIYFFIRKNCCMALWKFSLSSLFFSMTALTPYLNHPMGFFFKENVGLMCRLFCMFSRLLKWSPKFARYSFCSLLMITMIGIRIQDMVEKLDI